MLLTVDNLHIFSNMINALSQDSIFTHNAMRQKMGSFFPTSHGRFPVIFKHDNNMHVSFKHNAPKQLFMLLLLVYYFQVFSNTDVFFYP